MALREDIFLMRPTLKSFSERSSDLKKSGLKKPKPAANLSNLLASISIRIFLPFILGFIAIVSKLIFYLSIKPSTKERQLLQRPVQSITSGELIKSKSVATEQYCPAVLLPLGKGKQAGHQHRLQ